MNIIPFWRISFIGLLLIFHAWVTYVRWCEDRLRKSAIYRYDNTGRKAMCVGGKAQDHLGNFLKSSRPTKRNPFYWHAHVLLQDKKYNNNMHERIRGVQGAHPPFWPTLLAF